jgi:sugar lactone lactonase YvrE
MTFNVESPWPHRDALGEGPLWDATEQMLIRVDCERGLLHWLDVESGDQVTHNMGEQVGFAALATSGEAIVTVGQKLIAVSKDGRRRIISLEIDPSHNDTGRYNDGKVDPRGRLFGGTLDRSYTGGGGFYRFDSRGQAQRLFDGVSVANGLDWDVERKLMYWTDTMENRIDVFDYDIETGEVTGRRPFAHIDKEDGLPDGMTLDVEGGLWVALFQGSKVRRYDPDGTISVDLAMPTGCPTSIIIGGPDGQTAYVTTCQSWLTDEEKLSQNLGGAVLTFDAGVKGQTPGLLDL